MTNENSRDFSLEKLALITASNIKGVGYWTLYKFVANSGDLSDLLNCKTQDEFEALLHIKLQIKAGVWLEYLEDRKLHAKKTLDNFRKSGIQIVLYGESGFPQKLMDIVDPPYWLFVQGNIQLLSNKSIAVVGTRNPTQEGDRIARYVIESLIGCGYVTISGLANGIDQIVHEESLRCNLPTIAILGTGINNNYPAGSFILRSQIIEHGGAIVTEYLPSQSYSAENFIRRNRLQAALCDVLIPVEWAIKSGTAHTVSFASKYRKKIINIYLPGTYDSRPEIIFSQKNYRSKSYSTEKISDFRAELLSSVTENTPTILKQISLDI